MTANDQKSAETPDVGGLHPQCELLRGAFEDPAGYFRSARVDLPAIAAPAFLMTDDGVVLEMLGSKLPAIAILNGVVPSFHPVAPTAISSARYDAAEIETFRTLRFLLRHAVSHNDVALLGQVATASARIQQRRLPKPRFDALLNIAVSHGATGIGVSQRGAVALIFDRDMRTLEWSIHSAARAMRRFGIREARAL